MHVSDEEPDISVGYQEAYAYSDGEDMHDFESDEDEDVDEYEEPPTRSPSPAPSTDSARSYREAGVTTEYHLYIDGKPCDADGKYLPKDAPPAARPTPATDDWTPYQTQVEFELAEFLYTREQMSAGNIDQLLDLWAATLLPHGDEPPFADAKDLYETIHATKHGDVRWQSFNMSYQGELPAGNVPPWMTAEYDVWFRDPHTVAQNMLANPDFDSEMDYGPLREFNDGERQLKNFMGGDWAWKQADIISKDPDTHGAAFVPIVLGSDKTTVSVATGQNEYYPLYMGIGNTHNHVRRAHRNAIVLIGFLAIPKTDRKYADDVKFRKFRRQLFHSSLARILESLKPGMTTPEVTRCADGHFRRVIYGLGPYIADYPEQALLACIVQGWCPKCTAKNTDLDGDGAGRRSSQHTELLVENLELGILWDEYGLVGDIVPFTNDFPRADIHELLSPDLLHQLIKGTFKDHLVDWVEQYLIVTHGKRRAKEILADIDLRIAAVPAFSGLRRFHEGRGFKQWTGDDSKALMKVYLPAISGHVPQDMVRAIRAFLEFCYIARHNVITSQDLENLEDALSRFHQYRTVFEKAGVKVSGFSLPRQHSLRHYKFLIWEFAAPNGLCSSITEAKHIKAVKEPWRRSSRNEALGQMLLTNQALDKLSASRVDFASRGMLDVPALAASYLSLHPIDDAPDDTANEKSANAGEDGIPFPGPTVEGYVTMAVTKQRKHSRNLHYLAVEVNQPDLPTLVRRYLYRQLNPYSALPICDIPLDLCPVFNAKPKVYVHYSAAAVYYAPSDPSGIGGMRQEHIRATPTWRRKHPRFDCIFVKSAPRNDRIIVSAVDPCIARVLLFFSFTYDGKRHQCALVRWFECIGDQADDATGMWMVKPAVTAEGSPSTAVIRLDYILRSAHLIPVFGEGTIPLNLHEHHSLDAFHTFYVNKFADHHAFELLS
ncbi:hypothetical protein SCP_1301730 [Sparassis crispa]|uniref:Uncharacterized protein n=1 Tax=Sparassis crispa TaxID=139825 RepID=A0A401H1S4_9APHY|nr:hypothetical protein SCP_1301730 [Sparassis crispa]GBE88358.1 hypothetical protein SCP_1301730 [Sparassis crispa]